MLQFTHMLLAAASDEGIITGQIVYEGPSGTSSQSNNYTFVVPGGVTSISIVAVGAGWAESGDTGGWGGSLAYYNNVPVDAGSSITITIVGPGANQMYGTYINLTQSGVTRNIQVAKGNTNPSYTPQTSPQLTCSSSGANSGGAFGDEGTTYSGYSQYTGGGGAGGYTGGGGKGRWGSSTGFAGSGGGGGGGAGQAGLASGRWIGAGGGGGVGLLGQGANGAGGGFSTSGSGFSGGGGGGSGGSSGSNGGESTFTYYSEYYQQNVTGYMAKGGAGGNYGGAQGGGSGGYNSGSGGGRGAVRIIWPGTTRQFPNTLTGNL